MQRQVQVHNPFNYLTLMGLVIFLGFAIVWIFLIVPQMTSQSWFYTLNPVPAYFLYNIGFILLSVFFFNFILSFFTRAYHVKLIKAIILGIDGWLGFSLIFDLLQPPFYLSSSGQVLIPLGTQALENVSVDAMIATIWGSLIPPIVNTGTWFVFTYLVTPLLAVFVMAFTLSPKLFLGTLSGATR